jgi:ribosome-associated translation inhibitor RaiA
MELSIRGLGLRPTPVLKRYVERRLRHVLRSFDIDRVIVRLIRDRGRGRRDTHCCDVAVSLPGLSTFRVNESHGSIRGACSRAAAQTKRALVRAMQGSGSGATARGVVP